MDDKNNNMIEAEKVEETSLVDEMEDSYISYAMSVIAGRALPDVKDGLKPVQRRIIYSMHNEGIRHTKSHRKSSNIVGDVMGNYHPHGDSSIYQALVRMAQDYSLNQPLVDGQGNFGSIDGDPPAAMRYTEARMSEISSEMVKNINKNTVDFTSNYDDRVQEPEVLPSAFPNLLVNGSSGIAVGMSTSIPPHNLKDTINTAIHYIENSGCEVSDLIEKIKGPDFPTGGEIIGRENFVKAYKEGKGSVTVRAKYEKHPEENQIIVSEIPYKTEKSKLIKDIARLVKNEQLEGVTNVRDHSDRNRIKIVIDVRDHANIEVVEKKLIEKALEKKITILNLALVDGTPKVLNLKDFIREFVDHRKEVVRRRAEYDLKESKENLHITKGKLQAVDKSEEVIELIRNKKNKEEASQALQTEYNFTQEQAESILRLQLSSLTSMNIEELKEDKQELQDKVEELETLLDSEEKLLEEIKNQLEEIKDKYGKERRTEIITDYSRLTEEDLIPEKENLILLTEKGYVKRTPLGDYKTQSRGGKGLKATNLKNGDKVKQIKVGNSHSKYVVFTGDGNFYNIKGYDIPEKSRTTQPEHLTKIIPTEEEEIKTVVEVGEQDDHDYIVLLTREGLVKKTDIQEYITKYAENNSIKGINVRKNDDIVDSTKVREGEDIIISTEEGKAIRFNEEQVSKSGRTAQGVIGIKEGTATSISKIEKTENSLVTVSEDGRILKSPVENYSQQNRGGKGLKNMNTENGKIEKTEAQNKSKIITITDGENIIFFPLEEVRNISRGSKGVKAMNTSNNIEDIEIMDEL